MIKYRITNCIKKKNLSIRTIFPSDHYNESADFFNIKTCLFWMYVQPRELDISTSTINSTKNKNKNIFFLHSSAYFDVMKIYIHIKAYIFSYFTNTFYFKII